MDGKKYNCRRLRESDLENVMRWRMSPHVTQYMDTDPELTLEGQKKWFDALSSSGDFFYWVIEVDGSPCGLINLADVDWANRRAAHGVIMWRKRNSARLRWPWHWK